MYIIGDLTRIYIFSTNFLRLVCDPRSDGTRRFRYVQSNPTSRGYLMPVEYAERWHMDRIEFGERDDPSPFLAEAKRAHG